MGPYGDKAKAEEALQRVDSMRYERDTKRLIRLVLDSPMKPGYAYAVDGVKSMKELSELNTDVKTRVILQIAKQAMQGDIKSAQFLMKYGGLEPETRSMLTVELPQFIDDVAPPSALPVAEEHPEEEEEDEVETDENGLIVITPKGDERWPP